MVQSEYVNFWKQTGFMSLHVPPSSATVMSAGLPDSTGRRDRLVRSVVLARHGIRSPRQSDATLKQWSTRKWPVWPGNPGELTERGKALIRAQWSAMRPFFVENGLIPDEGFPVAGEYALIADEDQRTRQTAIALFDGLAPGCHVKPVYGSRYDLLFHPDSAIYRAMDRQKALAEVQALLDPLTTNPEIGRAIDLLQDLTGCCRPAVCGEPDGTGACPLQGLPNRMRIDPHVPKLDMTGKWHIASTLAEIMLLEFAQWPERKAGWGRVDEPVLRQLVPVHHAVFNATHRALSLAKGGGSHMLKYIRDTLLSETSPALSLLVGHDTNIAYVGGLLDIHWSDPVPGTDPVIPGSFLMFGLWLKANGKKEIRIHFYAPSLKSLRSLPVAVTQPVNMPVDKAVYEPDTFSKRVDRVTAL